MLQAQTTTSNACYDKWVLEQSELFFFISYWNWQKKIGWNCAAFKKKKVCFGFKHNKTVGTLESKRRLIILFPSCITIRVKWGQLCDLGHKLFLVLVLMSSAHVSRFITYLVETPGSPALQRCALTTSGPSNCVGPPRSTCSATADTSSGSIGMSDAVHLK